MRTTNLLPILALFLAWNGLVFADEAVLNNPSESASLFKTVVDTLSPEADTLYNFLDVNDEGGEWLRGLSFGIYKPKSHGIVLGSIRLGYIGQDDNFSKARGWYSGVNADLPGLTKRYVPETIQGVATYSYLSTLWSVAGRYGRVGLNGGYDADRDTPIAAVNFGLSGTW